MSTAPSEGYFAYGANMSSAVLGRRGIRPLAAHAAELRGFRLHFGVPGLPLVEPGFATVLAEATQTVHGVLYELSPSDLAALDGFEGGQERFAVIARTGEGAEVPATTYRSRRFRPGLKPSRRYLRLLVQGAREHGLPESWVRELERRPTAYVPLLSEYIAGSLWLTERLVAFARADP